MNPLQPLKPLVEKTLHIALSRVGVMEKPPGSNRGPEVEEYLRSVGLLGGQPWCMAKVFNDAETAAQSLKVKNPLPRTGACVVLERFARTLKILHDKPKKGDLFLMYGSPEGYRRACHTGEVIEVEANGEWFWTVEGNTNKNGSREGVGVYKKRRHLDKGRYAFVDFNAVAATAPWPAPAKTPALHVSAGPQYKVLLSGRLIGTADNLDGRCWFPAAKWCQALGVSYSWSNELQVSLIQGREAPLDIRKFAGPLSGLYTDVAPIRQLAKFSGLDIEFDKANHQVRISRRA